MPQISDGDTYDNLLQLLPPRLSTRILLQFFPPTSLSDVWDFLSQGTSLRQTQSSASKGNPASDPQNMKTHTRLFYSFCLFPSVVTAFVPTHTASSFLSADRLATRNRPALYASSPTTLKQPPTSETATTAEPEAPIVFPDNNNNNDAEFQKGFAIIAFITLLNASLAPVWHVVFQGNGPPPLFLNAIVSLTALGGLLVGGTFLDASVDSMSALADGDDEETEKWAWKSWRGGMELGLWKGLGMY